MSIPRDLGLSLVLHAVLITAWALSALQRAADAPREAPVWVEIEAAKAPSRARQQIVRSDSGEQSQSAAEDAFLGEKTRVVRRQEVKLGSTGASGGAAATSEPIRLKDLALGDFSRLATRNPSVPGTNQGEYIRGMKEGEQTALNTREFIFYSFFERIRSQLDRAWEPILRGELIRLYKGGRRLASDQDHITQVAVVLDHAGEVVRVEVLGESGTRLLDEAAIRAFNRAGPFPNPPRALLGTGGTVRIQWQFILKT